MLTTPSLRPRLLAALAAPEPTGPLALKDRPIVVFGAKSSLAVMHLPGLLRVGARLLAGLDDFCAETELHGMPVFKTRDFLRQRPALPADAVLVDFSAQALGQVACQRLGAAAGLPVFDLLQLLAAYQRASVYQTVNDMRSQTVARADDWLALADRLADDFSRETLYAVLLQRLEHDRDALRSVNIWGRDEYFGVGAQSDTFVAGHREHFVDCGAHRGTIVQKLLGATSGRYASIHAFEPDEQNFGHLCDVSPTPLENFHCHRFAVADRDQTLRFTETGTMGSRVSETGNVTIEARAIDGLVEHATFIKMDVEGFEARALRGAAGLIARQRPRLAIAAYHYAGDLLDIRDTLEELTGGGYHLRLRQHYHYFYDTILYASPRADWSPQPDAA